MTSSMKTIGGSLPLTLSFFLFFCNHPVDPPAVIYTPPAVFVGYVDNEYDSLPGNLTWRNTCKLAGDTIRLNFFSPDFMELNRIRSGDLLRIDLLPRLVDTLPEIKTGSVIFHMARYIDGTNYSYEVSPSDTLQQQFMVYMHVVSLSREHGGHIDLDNISVVPATLTGSHGIEIHRARIFGTIQ